MRIRNPGYGGGLREGVREEGGDVGGWREE